MVLDEFVAEVRRRTADGLVILVGAGISVRAPSGLPSAMELMRSAIAHFTGSFGSRLPAPEFRPEVLFQIVERHARNGLFIFLDHVLGGRPFNPNHEFAAQSLASGVHIITTNFDCLIEAACRRRGTPFSLSVDGADPGPSSPVVFKIHGSLHSPESMMVTINHINLGLSIPKDRLFRGLVTDRTLLVLGYSGLDQLDIMPALRSFPYNEVIWVDHDNGSTDVTAATPWNPYVATLPRLWYVRLDTGSLVDRLLTGVLGDTTSPVVSLPPPSPDFVTQARISIDILMHLNDYPAVLEMVAEHELTGDLHVDVAWMRAMISLQREDDPSLLDRRRELLTRIEALPSADRRPYLAVMAQYAEVGDEMARVAHLIDREMTSSDPLPETVLDAAAEIAFRYVGRLEFAEARRFTGLLLNKAEESGLLLPQARAHILMNAIITQEVDDGLKTSDLLHEAIEHADRAIFLLSSDIYNDQFFLFQTLNNKAIALRILGRHGEAVPLLQQVAEYFRERNTRLYAQSLHNLAAAHHDLGDLEESLRITDQALTTWGTIDGGIVQGRAFRLKARTLLERGRPEDRSQARALLDQALDRFRAGGSVLEVQNTIEDVARATGGDPSAPVH